MEIKYPVGCLKKENFSSEALEEKDTSRFKRSDDNLKLPENFKIGKAIGDGSCFFDSFRQGLEQQLGIQVTVEQMRHYCRDFAQNNPPEWFINAIANSHDNSGRVRSETPDSYTRNILSNDRWGDPEVEGRILCREYKVKLHVVEKSSYLLYLRQQVLNNERGFSKDIKSIIMDSNSNKTLASQLQKDHSEEAHGLLLNMVAFDGLDNVHQLISSSGSLPLGNINYGDKYTIHIINTGNGHFEPILSAQETQYDKGQSHSLPVTGDRVYEVTQQLQNCRIGKRPTSSFDSHLSFPKTSKLAVEEILRTFVTCFVAFFKTKVEAHFDESIGKKGGKTSSILSNLSAMGLIAGGMRSLSLPLFGSIIDHFVKGFAKGIHDQKSARVAASSFDRLIGNSDFIKILVKAAVAIFCSYEAQYVEKSNGKLGMFGVALLANNAVIRAIHYIQFQDLQDKKEDLEELSTLIIKCVILGNDGFRAKKASIRGKCEKFITESIFNQGEYLDILYDEDIYKKTGLVKITNNGNHYYVKDENDTGNFGYRVMFEWEEDVLNEWTKEGNVSGKCYEYSLRSEEVESKVDQIYSEIKEKEPASKGDIKKLSSLISESFERLQEAFKRDEKTNLSLSNLISRLLVVAINNDVHFTREEQSNEISMLWSLRNSVAISHDGLSDDFMRFKDILCCNIPLDQVKIILYCIEKGLLNDCCRRTFLEQAIMYNVVDIIDPLIEMDDLDFNDEYVIGMISCFDSVGVIKCLQRDRGMEILNIRDDDGNSLLHIAARNGSVRVVEHIGKTIPEMDFNIKNNYGETPKDLAESKPISLGCLRAPEEIENLSKVVELCSIFSAKRTPNTRLSNVESDAVTQEGSCAKKANFWRAW